MCESGADDNHEPTKVFVTRNREYARYYASRAVGGDLYVVKPMGAMIPSDNDFDAAPTWMCDRALIVSVYDRNVYLTRQQRWRVFKLGNAEGKSIPDLRHEFERMEHSALMLARATLLRQKERLEQEQLEAAIVEQNKRIEGAQ